MREADATMRRHEEDMKRKMNAQDAQAQEVVASARAKFESIEAQMKTQAQGGGAQAGAETGGPRGSPAQVQAQPQTFRLSQLCEREPKSKKNTYELARSQAIFSMTYS